MLRRSGKNQEGGATAVLERSLSSARHVFIFGEPASFLNCNAAFILYFVIHYRVSGVFNAASAITGGRSLTKAWISAFKLQTVNAAFQSFPLFSPGT